MDYCASAISDECELSAYAVSEGDQPKVDIFCLEYLVCLLLRFGVQILARAIIL